MNLAVVNQNNSASVVLPPAMDDMFVWYDTSESLTSSKNITTMYDKTDGGVTLENDAGVVDPDFAAMSGAFNGHRVMHFDQAGSAEKFFDSVVDWSPVTGGTGSLVTNPEYSIALVVSEDSAASGSEVLFKAEGNDGATFVIKRFNPNVVAQIDNFDDPRRNTANDDMVETFTEGDTDTVITTVQDMTITQDVRMFYNGAIGVTFSVPYGVQDLDGITLGKNWHGGIGEVIIWKKQLTTAEVTEAHNYLSDKWGGGS